MVTEHPFLPITKEIQEDMLRSMGLCSIDELFINVPEKFRLKRELKLPDSHSEYDVVLRLNELALKNKPATHYPTFLGAGVGLHYIPATVDALGNRSEFVTSYTSYQPEISQGMLQTLFEYQSMLAEILGLDIVNSSLYDHATSLGEAARMTIRVKKNRNKFLVPRTINPVHEQVLRTYAEPVGIDILPIEYNSSTGLISLEDLEAKLDESVAGVYIENPNYFGLLETQLDEISSLVHESGALLVAGVQILSLGLLRSPGEYGADIAIAEGQPLGMPVSYGGPLLGIFACRNDRKLIYQMPGRLVGMTTTEKEPFKRGFALTLSAREQHIRREKATSNICSNQALMAVRAAIYLATIGPNGLIQLGETILLKSNYAAQKLDEISGVVAPAIGNYIWGSFVVRFEKTTTKEIHDGLLERGFHGGVDLSQHFPELGQSMLFSVTEMHSKSKIDKVVQSIREIVGGDQ